MPLKQLGFWVAVPAFSPPEEPYLSGILNQTGILQNLNYMIGESNLLDSSNTDLFEFNEKFYSAWWMGGAQAYEVDQHSLETVRYLKDRNSNYVSIPAHPKKDLKTGDLFFQNFQSSSLGSKKPSMSQFMKAKKVIRPFLVRAFCNK